MSTHLREPRPTDPEGHARSDRAVAPSPARVETLLSLLADDSDVVVRSVRTELARRGRSALPALLRAERSPSPILRARARQLLTDRMREEAWRRLVGYAMRKKQDLETALILLDAFHRPGRDGHTTKRTLEVFGDAVRRRLEEPGMRASQVLREYLGTELRFSGDDTDTHRPDQVSLGRSLETRSGLPLTLCALYQSVATRAGITAHLLPVPGHVLLAVEEVAGGRRAILDPWSGGTELSRRDVLEHLGLHGITQEDRWLRPARPTSMFLRQVVNSIHGLREHDRRGESRALEVLAHVLADHPQSGI
tara:strand:+ start:11906 stop:12826 length:921 start_codon:yes stop_codon:yes gene_type:complete